MVMQKQKKQDSGRWRGSIELPALFYVVSCVCLCGSRGGGEYSVLKFLIVILSFSNHSHSHTHYISDRVTMRKETFFVVFRYFIIEKLYVCVSILCVIVNIMNVTFAFCFFSFDFYLIIKRPESWQSSPHDQPHNWPTAALPLPPSLLLPVV